MIELYLTAFFMGLFGSLHCLGMCGGITIAFNQTLDPKYSLRLSFIYQFFRILSYALLGLFAALFGYLLSDIKFPILPILSGIFMILLGLYLLNFGAPLLGLERLGHKLWRKIQPWQKRLLPIKNSKQAMMIGLLWGFLPCGLVYSALALAVSSSKPINGFALMLSFGLGTLPMMLFAGLASQKLLSILKSQALRTIAAILFISWGTFYIYSAASADHSHHQDAQLKQDTHHH